MRIIFIDDYQCSCQNGIGTFRDIFVSTISSYVEVSLTLVSLNSGCNEREEVNHQNWKELKLPFYNSGDWRSSGDLIASELLNVVSDLVDNIFIMNYSPCAEFINTLKKSYPLSKWIFIIHDQGWCAPLMGNRILLSKILNGAIVPVVSDSTAAFVKEYCYKELEIYNSVDKIVCLSDSMRKVLIQIYKIPKHKIVKIENGFTRQQATSRYVTKNRARAILGIPKLAKVIIYVGRPMRNKGFDALLIAVSKLRRKFPELRCVIAGDVNKVVSRWSLCRSCAANIILTGFLTPSELRKWYAAADIGVITSYSEQCSFAALEMMDAGLPIVSSNGMGLRDMFIDGINAFVVQIGNVVKVKRYAKRITDAVQTAFNTSTSLQKLFIQYNHRLLSTKYSSVEMANKYMKVFRNLEPMKN